MEGKSPVSRQDPKSDAAASTAKRGGPDPGSRPPPGMAMAESGDDANAGDPNFMTSLARGLRVIHAFSESHPTLSIADAARISGLPRATARRCLHTLRQLGYVGSAGHVFALRPKILSLGFAFLSSTPLTLMAEPVLRKLSGAVHESASIGILDEDEVVYVGRVATKRIMSVALNVGSRLPAYCTSMGRVLLAALPPRELEAYFNRVPLKAMTERTVTSREGLRRAMDSVRHKGFAMVDQELEFGLRSIAVPIRNTGGVVVAAMNLGFQAARVSRRDMEGRLLPALRSAANEIGELLVG